MSFNAIQPNTSIELTYEEIRGLLYLINRSDAMEILSKTNQANTPISLGAISGKHKLEESLKELVKIHY